MDAERRMLRHFLAAIAYRTQKAVRNAPEEYGDFRAVTGVRTPRQIVRHMTDVLEYAITLYTGGTRRTALAPSLSTQVNEFHRVLALLDGFLATGNLLHTTHERLLQGPLADAMSHTGQLAMLRRMAGSPIPPENFIEADIVDGRVGNDQMPPVSPDAEWYAAEEEPW